VAAYGATSLFERGSARDQHVLEPELRSKMGAHDFAQHLLTKAAERLRRGDYYSRRLGVHLSRVGDLGGFWDETDFHETRDTGFLLARLEELWQRVPRFPRQVDQFDEGIPYFRAVDCYHDREPALIEGDRTGQALPLLEERSERPTTESGR
jgi:hypothetical protein